MQNDVVQRLLEPSQLTLEQIQTVLHDTSAHQLDFVDYYFQHAVNETWVLEDGIVKNGNYNVERGLGVRAVVGEKTGFAYSDEVSLDAISAASNAAKAINSGTRSNAQHVTQGMSSVDVAPLYAAVNPIAATSDPEKIELLRRIDKYVRTQLPQVSQLVVSLSAVYEEVLIMASDGTLATDIRPLIRLNCSLLLEDGSRRERGSAGCGGRYAFSELFAEDTAGEPRWMRLANQAIHMAKTNLRAVAAPAGTIPVVLGAGWPGVLLHEAVGHGLEGDFNRKKSSTFSDRMGQLVASELCTVIDDGTLPNRRGSLTIDDEGTPSARNVLIENGVLTGYMQDKHNAKLMGHKATGNGRRESYAHLPMPRMTNTFMLGGSSSPEEIIESVDSGLYAPNFGGGQVDITSGKFVFSTSEAYLIEKGKIKHPVKGATLIGNGPEVMQHVSMVGNDLCLDDGIGVCGKDGQSVPVGVGQPTLKVDQLTVGGTQ